VQFYCNKCQAFAMFDFVWHYALPVALFAYCYGRILHIIRRQQKIVGIQLDRSHAAVTGCSTAGDRVVTSTVAPPAANLSRREMNVLQTMVAVIVCFIVCWTPGSLANVVVSLTVCFIFAGRMADPGFGKGVHRGSGGRGSSQWDLGSTLQYREFGDVAGDLLQSGGTVEQRSSSKYNEPVDLPVL